MDEQTLASFVGDRTRVLKYLLADPKQFAATCIQK